MTLSKQDFAGYIKQFQFRELFNNMGWNNDRTSQPIIADNVTFTLQGTAEKSGFKILLCNPSESGNIPDYNIRKKIETKVTKLFQEHLIIFVDARKQEQIWQLVVRQSGKPTKVTETRYHISQDPELLYQRASGLFFKLDEEEKITIVDVTKRVSDNFYQNNEKVTKQFYGKFKEEHTAFLDFIKGIDDKLNKDWYASLMLNRLMFCYFIQKKGFLDNNKNYLREKLKFCRDKKGKDKFYSFYRNFLLLLFHQGLGSPEHNKELKEEIGTIPYLNGGLFDEHELEKIYKKIDIDDKSFERIFDFFDQYEWHLDTRVTATGKDINPDVIGYIFEKYINDRAQMGAYYTKEDITEYISKNCILPYLFDETKRHYPKAFAPEAELWQMLKQSGDTYIYDAVKYGINSEDIWGDLPNDVKTGMDANQPDLVEKRKCWNVTAPAESALPTEIWREVIDRRKRYAEVNEKIKNGEISSINDFITYNLNIRQFAQDVIENTSDPEFIKFYYKSLNNITILDPACGSGAFLFAAMNILEPLYEAGIMRMRAFVEDEDRKNKEEKKQFSNKFKFFREVLENIQRPEHPNLQYFIYKSIILNNLYGVDLMNEAVEIAKLRLFLKLVATVDVDYRKPNLGLEPLPDVDFNIRAGNTLIGYATKTELEDAFSGQFDFDNNYEKINEKCDIVAHAFTYYKDIQLSYGDDYKDFKQAKEGLNKRLKDLNNELNLLLHEKTTDMNYNKWLVTHQPFHWFAEFYEIIHGKGGFDVVIGNPPYVEYKDSFFDYKIKGYSTLECCDLYAFVVERSTHLCNIKGAIGMIVPISIVSTDGFSPLRTTLRNALNCIWYSSYSMRPGKLFDGVEKHLTIFVSNRTSSNLFCTAKYHRWLTEERENLFPLISYTTIDETIFHNDSIPKIGTNIASLIIKKIKSNKPVSICTVKSSKHVIYHTRKLRYFLQFLDTSPKIYEDQGKLRVTSELKEIYFRNETDKYIGLSAYLSTLFFWYYISYSDCRNLNKREVSTFPFSLSELNPKIAKELERLAKLLLLNLQENSFFQEASYKKYGNLKMQVFQPRLGKHICDKIDSYLGDHFNFSQEELDFIINYDIKYRMGKELESEEGGAE